MPTFRARITPRSAFGTPLLGDTLFGQLCWAIRNRQGEARLTALLEAYTDGHPFLVVSDAMPAGYVPRPSLPGHVFILWTQPTGRRPKEENGSRSKR
jgi:CRISPR-associated protein Csm4